ncbi:MAG: hypothetical protein GOMPHAMPRED_005831 [Gomphillus americanus]|uniref:Uncharacterized protein n=1 Tax=Gomphillus americanus TaxID=1940652 RepID=A0A8H3FUG6_9LECA|nr:MAG: hypothetical protein GOMPHAMPRED_005831 [Gomphillus americanus]
MAANRINQFQPATESQSRKRKRSIEQTTTDTLINPSIKQSDPSLQAALQRMYPPKEIYHVKTSHIIRPDQWHPIDQTTQAYHPSMRQPLNRQLSWNDHGITAQTNGKVPHETVLDFLVDVMRNKHWRGDLTTTTTDLTSHKLTWPRLHFFDLTKTISSNPLLLRLSHLLEGRFTAATAHKLPYTRAVTVQGHTNQSAPITPRYIAAILIQALGKPNPAPCSLCAATASYITNDPDIPPFQTCISLSSLDLPPRFAACANHFWIGSVTDCSCVSLSAPLHQDESYDYFFDVFAPNASNYPLLLSGGLFK